MRSTVDVRYLIFIGIGMVAGFLLARALYLRPEGDVDGEGEGEGEA
tara:strand:- start:692 stop:829 length:138 start_codon:yes stop_codon:yes gene_type:complete